MKSLRGWGGPWAEPPTYESAYSAIADKNVKWFWYAGSVASVLLALNRCIDSISSPCHDRLFRGRRTLCWLLVPTVYAIVLASTTRPLLFVSYFFTWFFNPYLPYIPDRMLVYLNLAYVYHDVAVAVLLCVTYLVFIVAVALRGRGHTSTASIRSAQNLAFLQVLLISAVNCATCVCFVMWQYIDINFYVGQFFWTTAHGLPSVIYVVFNRTVRNETMRRIKRSHDGFAIRTITVVQSSRSVGAH
ncbi:SRT-27 protein [Aphelenchoides avenae]|nr:SRT-27 protein [Aphelenchus avenae]